MLSASELKNYASLRGVSIRDIEAYCNLGAGHISNILNGERPLTEDNHKQIADAINAAYSAKQNGTFKRAPLDKNKNAVKTTALDNSETKSSPKTKRNNTSK